MSSFHTGGFHALFVDGSVKFISDNLGSQGMHALSTINGGEAVGNY
jgi:prepilin-type processing-associated H-X9-DG protein